VSKKGNHVPGCIDPARRSRVCCEPRGKRTGSDVLASFDKEVTLGGRKKSGETVLNIHGSWEEGKRSLDRVTKPRL